MFGNADLIFGNLRCGCLTVLLQICADGGSACRIALDKRRLCRMQEGGMPAVVAIPQVVEELLVQFGDFFPNEPARRHFAEYLTGLILAEHKTVSGINREFAVTTVLST
jgi:hypothetical protein